MGLLLLTGCPEPSEAFTSFHPESATETGDIDDDLPSSDEGDEPDQPDDSPGYAAPDAPDDSEPGPGCGDFAVQPDEACDGWNLAFETCLSLGYAGGQLGCNDDCSYDESACIAPGCGNGIIDTAELCDGTPYPCWVLGYGGAFTNDGLASCGADCMPDASMCDSACAWGQPGCFCSTSVPCPDEYDCVPNPMYANAPGTCQPHLCTPGGGYCGLPTGVLEDCCSGTCINGQCTRASV